MSQVGCRLSEMFARFEAEAAALLTVVAPLDDNCNNLGIPPRTRYPVRLVQQPSSMLTTRLLGQPMRDALNATGVPSHSFEFL